MPIYSFECSHCHAHFEMRATFQEKEAGIRPECPECHAREAKQLIPGGLVIRSGEGVSFSGPACDPRDGVECCGR